MNSNTQHWPLLTNTKDHQPSTCTKQWLIKQMIETKIKEKQTRNWKNYDAMNEHKWRMTNHGCCSYFRGAAKGDVVESRDFFDALNGLFKSCKWLGSSTSLAKWPIQRGRKTTNNHLQAIQNGGWIDNHGRYLFPQTSMFPTMHIKMCKLVHHSKNRSAGCSHWWW